MFAATLQGSPWQRLQGEEASSEDAGRNEHTQAFAVGSQAPASFLLPPSRCPLSPSATGVGWGRGGFEKASLNDGKF